MADKGHLFDRAIEGALEILKPVLDEEQLRQAFSWLNTTSKKAVLGMIRSFGSAYEEDIDELRWQQIAQVVGDLLNDNDAVEQAVLKLDADDRVKLARLLRFLYHLE